MIQRELWRAALAAAMVWLLAACGPGVGGTGTGNGALPAGGAGLSYFGAQPANACLSAFGELLGCMPGTAEHPPQLPAATTLVGECAVATFEGDDVVLDVLCGGWSFSGRWGRATDGQLRYFGFVGQDPLLWPNDPATLEVQATSGALMLWLRSAEGELLAGPLALRTP